MTDPARAFVRALASYFFPDADDPQERRMLRFAAVLELRRILREPVVKDLKVL